MRLWYIDDLAVMIADDPIRPSVGVDADEAEEWVRHVAEEVEGFGQLDGPGLLSDFIETCWAEVNWQEIAVALNEAMGIED